MTADEAARLAVVEQRIKEAEEDIRMFRQQLDGPPRDESIRGRLHMLETSDNAAKAAAAAVEAVKLVNRQRFTRGEKLVTLAFSFCVLLLQTLTFVYLTQVHKP